MAASLFVFRSSDTGVLVWVFAAVQVLIAVGYVVAWGVTRRWALDVVGAGSWRATTSPISDR
ncbi:hypothetical protein [Mycolicibacterium brisbanense]